MRFMILVKADKTTEAGVLPSEMLLAEMGNYNAELVKAGVLLAAEGLQPSSKGARVRISEGKFTVTDGPFAETKELIAGYAIVEAKSKQEAIELTKRFLQVMGEGESEIRLMHDGPNCGPESTSELGEAKQPQRAQVAAKR